MLFGGIVLIVHILPLQMTPFWLFLSVLFFPQSKSMDLNVLSLVSDYFIESRSFAGLVCNRRGEGRMRIIQLILYDEQCFCNFFHISVKLL